jgi:hypothetical protein
MALAVVVDGKPLPEPEARAFWARFSEHMERNKGDLAGFARAEGLASVRPVMTPGGPELVASRTAPQQPYGRAEKTRSSAGSSETRGAAPRARKSRGKRAKS